MKKKKSAIDFLDLNKNADNWFLQIETFDPHEPFFAPERLKEKFPIVDGHSKFNGHLSY